MNHEGTQRFLSLDPIEFLSGDFNFYRYVGNEPVNFTDALGFAKCDKKERKKRQENIKKTKNPSWSSKIGKSARIGRAGVRTGVLIDIMTPEPTDLAPPKWIVEGIVFVASEVGFGLAAGILDDTLSDTDLDIAEKAEKDCKEKAEKEKNDGPKIKANIEHCGKVTTYGKSKKKPLAKRSDPIQYHRDHIPATEYMFQKAKYEIKNNPIYEALEIEALNPCMEKAILCEAPVIIMPDKIHQVGYTYGESSDKILSRRDIELSPNQIKRRDIDTYEKILRNKKPIDKKTGKAPNKKNQKKIDDANKKCKKAIEKGLKEIKQKDMNKFLDDKIKDNKDCPKGTTWDKSKKSCS